MKFMAGRNNLAGTVYVPWDCSNHCPFCTSKKEYSKLKLNQEAVFSELKNLVANPHIQEIVFTGGEPTANMEVLTSMIVYVKSHSHKKVYVNTTLPQQNFFRALKVFNDLIDGVNISRHGTSFEEDNKLFCNIVDDWAIKGFEIPVKINVVLTEKTTIEDVKKIIQRWNDFDNLTVCFRRDFRKTTVENLHRMDGDEILEYLINNMEFKHHSFCDVCDTMSFGNNVSFHRGLELSSLKLGKTMIVNDIIVFPDGTVTYDWDKKPITDLDGFMPKRNTHTNNTASRTTNKKKEMEFPNKVNTRIEKPTFAPSSCGVPVHCGIINSPTPSCYPSSCGVSFGRCAD